MITGFLAFLGAPLLERAFREKKRWAFSALTSRRSSPAFARALPRVQPGILAHLRPTSRELFLPFLLLAVP
eukprot:339698-Pyramimonas_sp.AAC.1